MDEKLNEKDREAVALGLMGDLARTYESLFKTMEDLREDFAPGGVVQPHKLLITAQMLAGEFRNRPPMYFPALVAYAVCRELKLTVPRSSPARVYEDISPECAASLLAMKKEMEERIKKKCIEALKNPPPE